MVMFLGLVAAVAGTLMGCGTLFSWNGRHATNVVELPASGAFTHRLTPEVGRRYTFAVQVVFDRNDLPVKEEVVVVEARMPFVAKVSDAKGTELMSAIGWFDPNEPPTILLGQAAHVRRDTELVAERLVGPVTAGGDGLVVSIDLGEDRIGVARIIERRMVIYDDRLPPSVARAFALGAAGFIVFMIGLALVVARFFRTRRKQSRAPAKTSS